MTLQASSQRQTKAKWFNPWAHALAQALRENTLMTVVSFLVYFGTIIGTVIGETASHYNMEQLRYILFDSEQLSALMPMIITVLSILQGVLMFRFLYRKKAVNAWFGMGITRGTLFSSRFAAGLVGVLLPIVLPMVTSLIINLQIFPDSGLILSRFFYLLSGMCVQAAVIFCITAVVCVTSGTVAESIWHSIVFVCIPTVVFVALNALMAKFLLGNSVGAYESIEYVGFFDLFQRLFALNPLTFTVNAFWRFASEQVDPSSYSSFSNITVDYLPVVGWLLAAAALAWLAYRCMKRVKPENAGIRGAGKATGFISVMTVTVLAFAIPFMIPFYLFGRLPDWLICVFACLTAGIVFTVFALVLKLVGRSAGRKGWLALPIGLAGMFALIGVLYTGGFGYSGYTPDIRDVKRVVITYKGDGAAMSEGVYASGSLLYPMQQLQERVDLTAPEDMALALQLHKDLIQAGHLAFNNSDDIQKTVFGTGVYISYTVNNGRIVERCYQKMQMEALEKMLALDNAAGVKALMRDKVTGMNRKENDRNAFADGPVFISSRFLSETERIRLDASKRKELLECIAADLESQSVQDRYFPQKAESCILEFADGLDADDLNAQTDSTDIYESIRFSGFIDNTGVPVDSSNIYVTDGFAKTTAFLKENGFGSYLDAEPQADEIDLVDYRDIISRYTTSNNGFSPLYQGSAGKKNTLEEFINDPYFAAMFRNMTRITDPGKISEILALSRSKYFCSGGGYVVYIKHKDRDMMTSVFLPMKDAPEYLKQNAR